MTISQKLSESQAKAKLRDYFDDEYSENAITYVKAVKVANYSDFIFLYDSSENAFRFIISDENIKNWGKLISL